MQHKWKSIIVNWINCYLHENNNKTDESVNQESLLNIICHLRENFNLNESKSSIFSGQSLEEFILEKYPGFLFENGTVEARNDEEIFIAASLLLFFVCVNSKDVDIKSAMCSKLSTSDQEVILKFSKSLMKCSSIASSDVVAAITEACGPDMATGEGACGYPVVAETPPALRSLHGEVRRLQAALEAERFDRNYLQDELVRTNSKVEKLLKDKEQYKLDIVNLKAKISECCGEEAEVCGNVSRSDDNLKLTKQLQQMEQRVVDVQEQLEEAQHERDTFKAKLEELKGECDRLVIMNQQQNSQVIQLTEELEMEKRQSQTLRELVAELRQHNYRNGLDTSLLECDDPDTSVLSLQRSFSTCSEVCANVVEVQLAEERAKTQALKQQLKLLQDQVDEQLQTAEKFKQIISEREDDIFNLKHRINEEIEEKDNLKSYYDNEITQLNNTVNELEQQIKQNHEHSRLTIERNMQEIQILQEEKLSLLNSFSDEAMKSEKLIRDLRTEIEAEKTSKVKLRDDYENHVMKLKEKVLNRNNELVELQNNVLQKSEMIEQMCLELRKERELKDEIICKFNNDLAILKTEKLNVQKDLENKCMEVSELLKQISQSDDCIKSMANELEYLNNSNSTLKEDCRNLEETKQNLLDDIQNRQISSDKIRKELENLRQLHIEEKDKLQCNLDEMCAMVDSLQTQLQNEIHFKIGLQHELEKTQGVITKLSNTNSKLHSELSEIKVKMRDDSEILKKKDLILIEKEESIMKLRQEFDYLNNNMEKLSSTVLQKDKVIQEYENNLGNLKITLENENAENKQIVDLLNKDLASASETIEKIQNSIAIVKQEKDEIIKENKNILSEVKESHNKLKDDYEKVKSNLEYQCSKILEKDNTIEEWKNKFNDLSKSLHEEVRKNNQMIESMTSINAQNQDLQNLVSLLTREKEEIVREKDLELQQERETIEEIKNNYDVLNNNVEQLKSEMLVKDKSLEQCQSIINDLNKSMQEEIIKYKNIIDALNEDVNSLNVQKQSLENSITLLLQEKAEIIKEKELILQEAKDSYAKLEDDYEKIKINMEQLSVNVLEKEEVIQKCKEDLNHMNKTMQDEMTKNKKLIDFLNEDLATVNAENQSYRNSITLLLQEKDEINKEKELISQEAKDSYAKLEDDYEKIKINIEKLSMNVLEKEEVIQKYKEDLNHINKTMHEEMTKNKQLIDFLNEDLATVNAQNQSYRNSITLLLQEKDEIKKERDLISQEAKESYKILNDDYEKTKINIVQLSNEVFQKDEILQRYKDDLKSMKETIKKNELLIDSLNEDLAKINAHNKSLQNSITLLIQEKNEIISEKDIKLLQEKEICKKLEKDNHELKDKLGQLSGEVKRKDEILEECQSELRIQNETLNKEIAKYKETAESLNENLDSLSAQKQSVYNTIKLLKDENANLVKIVNEKSDFIIQLERERESLSQKMEEKGATIHSLEQKLNEKMLSFMNIENNFGIEISKLVTKLSDTEKTFKDIKIKSNKIIENQEAQIQALNADIFALKGVIESGTKDRGKLEQNLKEVIMKSQEIEKDYLVKCKGLEDVNNELRNEIKIKEKDICHFNEKLLLLTSTLAEKEKELSLLNDTFKECNTKKDIINEELKQENEILLKELEEIRKTNEILNEEIISKTQITITLEKEIKSLTNQIVVIKEERNSFEELTAQLEKERSNLRNKCTELEHEVLKKIEERDILQTQVNKVNNSLDELKSNLVQLEREKLELVDVIEKNKSEIEKLEKIVENEIEEKLNLNQIFEAEKTKLSTDYNIVQNRESELTHELKQQLVLSNSLQDELNNKNIKIKDLELMNNTQENLIVNVKAEKENLEIEKDNLIKEKMSCQLKISNLENEISTIQNEVLPKLKEENLHLVKMVHEHKNEINNLEGLMKNELQRNEELRQNYDAEITNLATKCNLLQEELTKGEIELEQRNSQIKELRTQMETTTSEAKHIEDVLKRDYEKLLQSNEEKSLEINRLTRKLEEERASTIHCQKEIDLKENIIAELKHNLSIAENVNEDFQVLKKDHQQLVEALRRKEDEFALLQTETNEWKIKKDMLEVEFFEEKNALQIALQLQVDNNEKLEREKKQEALHTEQLNEKLRSNDIVINDLQNYKNDCDKLVAKLEKINDEFKRENEILMNEKHKLTEENNDLLKILNVLQNEFDIVQKEKSKLQEENSVLIDMVEKNKSVIINLETLIKNELEKNELLHKEYSIEKLELTEKCKTLQANNVKVESELEQRLTEINALKEEIKIVTSEAKAHDSDLKQKSERLSKIIEEKDEFIIKINEELSKEKLLKDEYQKEVLLKEENIRIMQIKLEELKALSERNEVLSKENKELVKRIEQMETNAAVAVEKSHEQWSALAERNEREPHAQVDSISSTNIIHSSMENNKTIADLERILHDKNRTITTLQGDVAYMKSVMAESENKVLDMTKDLEISRENCLQLSTQLKKIVHQKNEEIMDLRKQVTKMSATENRASQIIKVSAKYQEIIHKRIAEIKSNSVLKELTNFGNTANCDSDLKRTLNSGAITMEELENFLETTERHLRRCAEKRIALQKERDRFAEMNRINESDIINIRKFLTELSVSVKTFNSFKEMYTQKLSRIVSLQRTVRREILSAEDRLGDAAMCKLERAYAAVMQDLAECTLNLERWVERSIGRVISAEKIKQAFSSEDERLSLAPAGFQNAGIEVQMEELENSFQKLLEEVARALKGDGVRDAQAATVKEVRAEYEDKLTRMKAKMKELYCEQIEIFKEKQRQEIVGLEQELRRTRDKLEESSKAYEEHIRGLTSELWRLGEKFLDKTDEAEWLRRKQRSESLMSLQHVPSSGFAAQPEDHSRASDTHSLRSLPVNINKKKEGRGLHMSDEEGEVFDNRFLRELRTPSRARDTAPRLSELRWRNSLCPPHLKSSYPAETQFAPALNEDDIKSGPTNASVASRQQRKEVGITAYKKPGPPTPSKQAGRLSATDSELRESLRVETEPQAAPRKTTTPSRLRSLFSSARNETVEGTPRSRRLSNFFRKK